MLDADAYLFAGDAEHAARIWPLIIGKTAGGIERRSACRCRTKERPPDALRAWCPIA
jgi:hypothetical protein